MKNRSIVAVAVLVGVFVAAAFVLNGTSALILPSLNLDAGETFPYEFQNDCASLAGVISFNIEGLSELGMTSTEFAQNHDIRWTFMKVSGSFPELRHGTTGFAEINPIGPDAVLVIHNFGPGGDSANLCRIEFGLVGSAPEPDPQPICGDSICDPGESHSTCAADCPLICAQDVFECPDGSTVSRDPAKNCQFPACPGNDPAPDPDPGPLPAPQDDVTLILILLIAVAGGAGVLYVWGRD